MRRLLVLLAALAIVAPEALGQGRWILLQENAREWVYHEGGTLQYEHDGEGNRIPDFSYAGYRNGMPVPPVSALQQNFELPIVEVRAPRAGSSTAGIQEAIDAACGSYPLRQATRNRQIHALPAYLPEERYRALVRLGPGRYELSRPVVIPCSGIVLVGAGQESSDAAPTTVLVGLRKSDVPDRPDRAPLHQYNEVLFVGTDTWHSWSQYAIDEDTMARRGHVLRRGRVQVGARTLRFEGGASATSDFAVGDNIVIVQRCNQQWIDDRHKGGIYQRVGYPNPEFAHLEWSCDDTSYPRSRPFEIRYHRYVTEIADGTMTVDAPVFDHLNDNAQAVVYVARHSPDPAPVQHVGIQGLSIEIGYDRNVTCTNPHSPTPYHCSEANTRNGIQLRNVENAWIRDVHVRHFRYAAVATDQTSRTSILNTVARDPVSIIESGRRYSFHLGPSSQLVLVANSTSFDGRHSFAANGFNISGNVFYDTRAHRSLEASQGHQRWSHGLLWDNHQELEVVHHPHTMTVMALFNRHWWGGHGWSTVQSIAWNADLGGGTLRLQKPPRGMNWALGVRGTGPESTCGHHHIPAHPYQHCIQGQFSRRMSARQPPSLYQAQLRERRDLDFTYAD